MVLTWIGIGDVIYLDGNKDYKAKITKITKIRIYYNKIDSNLKDSNSIETFEEAYKQGRIKFIKSEFLEHRKRLIES